MKKVVLTLFLIPAVLFAATPQRKTVWDGVFTEEQAFKGEAVYGQSCRSCHGETLEGGTGFALKGSQFMDGWREDNLESLFTFIKTTMPPRSSTAELSDEATLSVVSYILWENDFPTGKTDLHIPDLRAIQIQEKDGPKPLPNFALVEMVGCLTKVDAANWSLTHAATPVRTRKVAKLTPEEIKSAATRPLGAESFPLQGWRMLGAFDQEAHANHRVHAKGVLMQQRDGIRLSLTTLAPLAPSCP